MLPSASLGDDAFFAHAFGEQSLADGVVDFVSAGVVEIFALEINFSAAEFFRESPREIKPRRLADVVVQVGFEFANEGGVRFGAAILCVELLKRGHERFRDENATIRAEMARGVRNGGTGGRRRWHAGIVGGGGKNVNLTLAEAGR